MFVTFSLSSLQHVRICPSCCCKILAAATVASEDSSTPCSPSHCIHLQLPPPHPFVLHCGGAFAVDRLQVEGGHLHAASILREQALFTLLAAKQTRDCISHTQLSSSVTLRDKSRCRTVNTAARTSPASRHLAASAHEVPVTFHHATKAQTKRGPLRIFVNMHFKSLLVSPPTCCCQTGCSMKLCLFISLGEKM